MQGGISTPVAHPLIFAFTGATGRRHGHADEWAADGTLRYFGQGQEGDMGMNAGNKAIANQLADGKELLLFEGLGSGEARYMSVAYCGVWFGAVLTTVIAAPTGIVSAAISCAMPALCAASASKNTSRLRNSSICWGRSAVRSL
jgi:hypothetical protein